MPGDLPISQLPSALTGANVDVDADYLPIDDVSTGATKRITPKELIANTASFVASGSGATARTVQGRLRDWVSVLDFIPVTEHAAIYAGTSATDLTAYIQAAFNDVYDNKRGDLWFPAGSYKFDSISKTFVLTGGTRRSVNICGAGTKSVYFSKFTPANTDPFFNISTDASGAIELNCTFGGFTITGSSKASDGIKVSRAAYFTLEDVEITACDKAFHGLGVLVSDVAHRCRLRSNNIGVYLRKESTSPVIRPNAVWINKAVISSNSSFGVDYGDGAMLTFLECDMEENGATGDTATGAIMIRTSTDEEASVAYAQVNIYDTWFENNDGRTLQTEASTELILSIKGSKFAGDEVAANIGSGYIYIDSTACHTGTFTIAGTASAIKNSAIHTITDTCTVQTRENVFTNAVNGGVRFVGTVKAASDGLLDSETGGLQATNQTTPAKWTQIGYDGTADVGYIKAIHSGTDLKNLVVGVGSALSTGTKVGFMMIASCAGTPTGVPVGTAAGRIAMIYDTTNDMIYFYNGGWRGVAVT